MQKLVERIRAEGQHLGGGILKVDGFINHRLEPDLTLEMGKAFVEQFYAAGVTGVTKIVTAEVSGIAPALATGIALGVPVVYARKTRPVTMAGVKGRDVYEAEAPSHTKGGVTKLIISPEYLREEDHVLLIDDFLASGKTLVALTDLIRQCGATLLGVGCVIEKSFEGGREALREVDVPVVTLAVVTKLEGDTVEVRDTDMKSADTKEEVQG